MGQIYEAHQTLRKLSLSRQPDWTKYPELAADLMISGHPMELMDGDAGHVPLIWISSLLKEVINKLGDQRVFVLSVLGVQSSGKSTMLNAMFGLQFTVSAGRCTKGAYMQLVKLSEEIKDKYKFDYILVVDTEGLRALELAGNATLHHDNELATFVVGLGNMTLINIFGENPAEMQDVLQIVVQAFMRMKKVKLSPSCVFVHQNVTDITAAEKNMDGKRRLQEKLDKMAQLAAKEEELAKNVKQKVTEFESGKKFTFKKEFTVDLSLYVFDRAEGWLLNSHKIYRDNNDALTYLDNKKNEYYNIFRSFCKGSSSAVVFGEIMCEKLKVSAVEAVCNKTGVDIAGQMMCSFPAFNGNRLNLEKHVLASLAEKEDFNRFTTYIRNPRAQVEAFIKEQVKKYMFMTQKVKAQNILKKNVEEISRVISQALFEATEKFQHIKGNIEMWVEEFSRKLKPKLILDIVSCQNFSDINNFDFLKEEIEKGLK
ncbi:interferon-induced very large GTPase 1-like, partial [Poecilia latipinna]|uniref:interferon-induced very large GTPase 1-like n=1 Tax=Poecilia latipinna TaxID=48699 RepID=UPI00072E2B05